MTAPPRMTDLLLPRRARGRPSPNAEAAYQEQRQAFCTLEPRNPVTPCAELYVRVTCAMPGY